MEKLAMTLLAFEPILLKKMDAYRQRLSQTPQKGSDYSLSTCGVGKRPMIFNGPGMIL